MDEGKTENCQMNFTMKQFYFANEDDIFPNSCTSQAKFIFFGEHHLVLWLLYTVKVGDFHEWETDLRRRSV